LRRTAEDERLRYQIPDPRFQIHPATPRHLNGIIHDLGESGIRHPASGILLPETLVNSRIQE
jgi:hypothetical protein